MSGELKTQSQSGDTIYAVAFKGIQVLNVSTVALETYVTASLGSYDIALTEQGSSGRFVGSVPAGTPAGRYDFFYYSQQGANPAEGDIFVGNASLYWSGDTETSDPGSTDTTIALITLDEAKEYLKVNASDDDAILSTFINMASAWVGRYIGRNLVRTTYVEYYNGDGTKDLILRHSPIVSVTSIYIDSLRAWASSSLVATTNYIVKKASGIIKAWYLFGCFPCGESNIKVTYVAGYTAGSDMPQDVRFAVKRLVEFYYRIGYTHRKLDYSSESLEGMNVNFKDFDIPKDVKLVLEPYRKFLGSPQFDYAD
jgi:uncharacterized phiE125 gp8 family phage protein